MSKRGAILGIAAWMPIAAVSAFAQGASDIRTTIDNGNAAFIQAYKEADAAGLAALFDEDGVRLLRGGIVLRGRAAIQSDAAKDFQELGPMQLTIQTADVWVLGDLAYEKGTFTFTAHPPKEEPRSMTGRYTVAWKKQRDGSWKMLTELSEPVEDCGPSGPAIAGDPSRQAASDNVTLR